MKRQPYLLEDVHETEGPAQGTRAGVFAVELARYLVEIGWIREEKRAVNTAGFGALSVPLRRRQRWQPAISAPVIVTVTIVGVSHSHWREQFHVNALTGGTGERTELRRETETTQTSDVRYRLIASPA